jgi:FlaA1/EpsC-like NDP-sugar epimerase
VQPGTKENTPSFICKYRSLTLSIEALPVPLIKRLSIIAGHAFLIGLSVLLAWLLRFEFHLPNLLLLLSAIPVLIFLRVASLARVGLLHSYWRYTSISDVTETGKATLLGSVCFFVSIRYVLDLKAFPLSVYCLEAILTLILLLGVRLIAASVMPKAPTQQPAERRRSQKVLIAGAGFAGQMLIRELREAGRQWEVVGCVDDDPGKRGLKISGITVLGSIAEIQQVSAAHRAFEVLIAIPSATAAQMKRIVEICDAAKIRYKTVPSLRDFIVGRPTFQQLREVNLEDLLGRDPIKLDLEPVRRQLQGTAVLVTGAAGSIGSELVHQILQYRPALLLCLDQDESGLFDLQQRLPGAPASTKVEFLIADITDRTRMHALLSRFEVNSIFHAAAYKHVSLTESNVCEALANNVFGLLSVLEAAEHSKCGSFVLVSSDKAVNPTSFMGCTKRLGELILAGRPTSSMRCVTVRFGNVLGSQGSVVPLFQQQIRAKKQITVTHPEITRYFMTIPEAVALVLQAFTIGEHGDLLVLDMGKPLRILDLANTLMKLSGVPEQEVKITFSGLRPGEKLHEELFYASEDQRTTSVEKITLARSATMPWQRLSEHLEVLRAMAAREMPLEVRGLVKEIIPEYAYLLDPTRVDTTRVDNSQVLPLGWMAGGEVVRGEMTASTASAD